MSDDAAATVEFVPLPPERDLNHSRVCNTFTPEVVDAIQARPGEWARVARDTTSNRVIAWRDTGRRKGFQITTRATAAGMDVYARWAR